MIIQEIHRHENEILGRLLRVLETEHRLHTIILYSFQQVKQNEKRHAVQG